MKVARTVLRGGNFSNRMTYLDRPYAALLLLVIGYVWTRCSVEGNWLDRIETPLLSLSYQ